MINWLYLDLNSFFASCEQQERPELRGKPVAVVPMLVDSTSVIAASYPAKQFGVKTGTRVGDARQMCPGIQFVVGHHRLYVEYHHRILEAVESCAPIDGVMSIDEIAIRLTGSQQQVPVAVGLAYKIKHAIRDRVGEALTSSIGIAPNRYLAKVAADMQKPDGLTIIEHKDLPHILFQLQLQDLPGIGPRTEKRLRLLGVSSVQDLCSRSCNEFEKRLWRSVWGNRMWRWLHGEDLLLQTSNNKSISHQHVLSPNLRNYDGGFKAVQQLLIKATVRMRKSSLLARRLQIDVKAYGHSFEKSYFQHYLSFHETNDTIELLKYLQNLWYKLPLSLRPHRVGITLCDFKEEQYHQLSLFENTQRTHLNRAIDELNQRFGRDTVKFGCVADSDSAKTSKIAFQHVPDLDDL